MKREGTNTGEPWIDRRPASWFLLSLEYVIFVSEYVINTHIKRMRMGPER